MTPFSAGQQDRLVTIVAEGLARQGAPGAIAGVWRGERAWVHAAGLGNLERQTPISRDGHVRIASVSKTFVATTLLQLIDEGALTLEETLARYVPGVPHGERITMRQLLGMTAGIFNYINDPTFEAAYTANPLLPFDPRQAIEIIGRHEPDFLPGAGVRYSDSNYLLLGFVLEAVTGQRAAELITARVIEPLGLTGTSFPATPLMPEPFPSGYAHDPGSGALRDLTQSNPAVPWTAGAMISTLDDLGAWAGVLARGDLLSEAMQHERLQLQPLAIGPDLTCGYGLGIMAVNGFLGHAGAIFGYSTWMLHAPAREATIVVLANRGETETEFAGEMALAMLREFL